MKGFVIFDRDGRYSASPLLTTVLLLFTAFYCQTSLASYSPRPPETLGFSSERLARIAPAMQRYIDEQKLAGIITLVAKDGEVAYVDIQGKANIASDQAMHLDTIFRIYSMTKPVTAVAALQLWEQGKFHMHDPVTKYLPQLSDLKVYISGEGEQMQTEPAKTPLRIIDLFMHTAGFSYGFSNSPVDQLYQQSPLLSGKLDRDAMLKELASLPLVHQPGTDWHYGVNTDVLGSVVEVISGMDLPEYMEKHIFAPLGMKDTGFTVPEDKIHRFAEVYTVNQQGMTIPMQAPPLGDYRQLPLVASGGGGLVSTLGDYLLFAQMLLNNGEHKGRAILSPRSVTYMRTNHLPDALLPTAENMPGEGFGMAVGVTMQPQLTGFLGSQGDYGWGGMASTYFRIDPKENMILIALTQLVPYGFYPYQNDFRNLVYQSLLK